MSPFTLTRTLPKPTSDREEFPFHSRCLFHSQYPRRIQSHLGDVRRVTSVETTNAGCSEASRVDYDVSASVSFKNPSRRRPLKLSTKALCTGFPVAT
jgi:hypothetical protein